MRATRQIAKELDDAIGDYRRCNRVVASANDTIAAGERVKTLCRELIDHVDEKTAFTRLCAQQWGWDTGQTD